MNDRELDALVAERVMGLTREDIHRRTMVRSDLPHYSTDIAAAWEVVGIMAERGYWCQMRTPFEGYGRGDYWAGFTPHNTTGWNGKPDHWTSAELQSRAICLAALKAVGVEVEV